MLIRSLLLVLLLAVPSQARASGYVVRPGDTLTSIATTQHVSLTQLAGANGISNLNFVRAGTVLLIPASVRRVHAHSFWYRVQWGDTLLGISGRYRIYISAIHALNPQLGAYPLAGQWLRLCGPCSSYLVAQNQAAAATPGVVPTGSASFYLVRPGDSLLAIASRFRTTVSSLITVNHVLNPDVIVIGSRLALPGGLAPAYAPMSARSLIVSYARAYGVEPALALAIGWQESGFNQTALSSTGAIGVMQVEPYTGTTIANLLGRPINLYLMQDNIQAGVFWLAHLLAYYGGDVHLAVAAYYQGTRSIARRGFFQDTTQYVNNVLSLQAQFGG